MALGPFDFLRVTVDDDVVRVTLDRPPVNAVNQQMYRELRHLFSEVGEHAPTARLLVLQGAGRHFCAGNDKDEFATMTAGNAASRMREVREAFAAIYECPIPTLAVVTGAALGTGAAIAACCDIVVASDDAQIGAPEVGVGVMGGGRHLARLVGESRMRRMYFTATPVSAQELASDGAVHAAPADQLAAVVDGYVTRIRQHSPVVLRYAKASLNRSEFLPLKAAYEVEQEFTVALAATADSAEARAALAERRQPAWPSLSDRKAATPAGHGGETRPSER